MVFTTCRIKILVSLLLGKISKLALLILDNYDSFTWNLVHYAEQFTEHVEVHRNDCITIEEVKRFDAILLSPGPGLPKDAGVMPELIATYHQSKPILGICLGMQAIAEFYGASLYNLQTVMHGVASQATILDPKAVLFHHLDSPLTIGHYHSWAVEKESLPAHLIATATNEHGILMGIRHQKYPVSGLQFHPESVLTENGLQMIENWVNYWNKK